MHRRSPGHPSGSWDKTSAPSSEASSLVRAINGESLERRRELSALRQRLAALDTEARQAAGRSIGFRGDPFLVARVLDGDVVAPQEVIRRLAHLLSVNPDDLARVLRAVGRERAAPRAPWAHGPMMPHVCDETRTTALRPTAPPDEDVDD